MSLIDLLFGRPLKSSDERGEKLGPAAGIAVFGLDALSSPAYGPEAALTWLIPLGTAGITYIVPTSVGVVTVSKFAEGAWVTTLLIPGIMILMISVRRHYDREQAETAKPEPLDLRDLREPLVVVPILRW